MPARQLTITELQRTANGSFVELPTKFSWDHQSQTGHRGSWEYLLKVRTAKEHYPGTTQPTEQVLGWNWEPFQMQGVWDNRWASRKFNDADFAENTRKKFERMVKRGNFVRVEFESISVTGIITDFKIAYKTSYRVGWEFTFSPHFHGDDSIVQVVPKVVAQPSTYVVDLQAIRDAMDSVHLLCPRTVMVGDLAKDVDAAVAIIHGQCDTALSVVQNRVLLNTTPAAEQSVNSVARVAAAFGSLAAASAALLPLLADNPTNTALTVQQAIHVLSFNAWSRGMAYQARAMMLAALAAREDLLTRVGPDAMALYRPQNGESLYAISNRFYHTPHRWREISDRNNLKVFILQGTELLVIPNKRGG